MNFDLDDPLAGILSDGSDDSFFDDDILGKKKSKKKLAPAAEKKNALFNLDPGEDKKEKPSSDIGSGSFSKRKNSIFDLDDSNIKSIPSKQESSTSVKKDTSKGFSPAPFRRTVSKESVLMPAAESNKTSLTAPMDILKSPAKGKSNISLDLLDESNVGIKKEKKVLERGKSSQSILDDILGGSSTKATPKQLVTKPSNTIKNQDLLVDDLTRKGESQSISATKNTQKKEDTQKKKTKSSEDWLGIFKDKDVDDEKEDDGMPSWLLGADNKKDKKIDKQKVDNVEQPQPETETKKNRRVSVDKAEPILVARGMEEFLNPMQATNFQGSNEDITTEGAALYLQQQESQLMVALQLKAQEEKLAAMQVRQEESQRIQREAARAHHVQLDSMLQRQAAHRQQMQAVIAAHQDRINDRIKALLGPTQNDINAETDDGLYNKEGKVEVDSPYSKEKKQLVQLVQTLQENHDKEMDLMETSYRRQMAFIEVLLIQSEERMKGESEKLVKFYTEKIGWLEEHHQSYKQLTENNISSLMERHSKETELLRQQHTDNIRALQEHHATLMENVKNATKQEQTLIQEGAGFSSNLQELVTDVKENKTQCTLLVQTVQALVESTQGDAERHLQVKDVQVNEMILQLKKDREYFESEKIESRDLVKLLETRLKQMTQYVEEEAGALKQKKMEFEFEKATFNKQTEFAKNVLKNQDEEIKVLRQDIQKEYKEKMSMLEEEKSKVQKDSISVAKEKASIQHLKQELEKMKAELQVQLEEVSEESSKLNVEKQHVHMEAQRIVAKSRDLELLAKTAVEKQFQADQKYTEAEHIQKKYEERIRRIQEHVVSVNSREKHIAREKVALSRERLHLHNQRRQVENRQQCSLCKSMRNVTEFDELPQSFMRVPSASRDYSGGEVTSAMSNIEQEMAHLLGRNLGLKTTDIPEDLDDGKTYHIDTSQVEVPQLFRSNSGMQDYMDPKLLMLRLEVQKVIGNIEQNKSEKEDENKLEE